ncbi:MAG: acetate--CoA ligase family protein [Gemmatimonadota bacterium]|nr:acetate--CoA ligase family protein [Gemmatimonadota bacterium]
MSEHPLRPIFEPRSVGVVGASADPAKRGHQVVAALRRSGFAGSIHPINPRGGEILGLPVATSVAELAEPPELVYVATPATAVPDVVAECGAAGVCGAIVPAVGFGESGEPGRDLERRLVDAARTTGIRVVGPNTSGLLNTHIGLHMVGGEPLEPGRLGIVSQSGNVALDLMTTAARRPVGVSIYVGPGNEIDVGFHEIIDFLASHAPTRAIVVYIEGVKQGRALYDIVKRIATEKPVVVLKGGKSDDGVRAARSHTGAVAGSYAVFRAAATQAGMVEVDASDELFAVGEALALQPRPRVATTTAEGTPIDAPASSPSSKSPPREDAGFVVISDGGGHGTIAADRFAALGVPLARLAAETKSRLREILGPASSVENPIDAAGAPDAAPSVLTRAVEAAVSDPACAGILVIGLLGGYAIRFSESLAGEELEAASGLARAAGLARVPLVVHSLYERRSPPPLRVLLEADVPVHGSLERAALCCAALWRRRAPGSRLVGRPARPSAPPDVSVPDEPGRWLSEVEARSLVEAAGVSVVEGIFCRGAEDVAAAAWRLDGPWAIKAVSAALPHKSEAGAVRLGIDTPDQLERAFDDVTGSAREYLRFRGAPTDGDDPVDGALVTRMLAPPTAELLIGARRDESFGPILTVGFGGVDVELSPDVAIRLLPVAEDEIRGMWTGLRRAPILLGHRGAPAADLDSLVRIASAVADCLLDDPTLVDLELNPVFAHANGAVAIDAMARRSAPESAPEGRVYES